MLIPSPPPSLIAHFTAQQELKYVMYLFVLYMPYSQISQDKKVFNLENKIQRYF